MVNELELEKAITDSGKTKTFLANKCGMTIQTFRLKCTNRSDFTNVETDILCGELGIRTLTRMHEIFFAKNVDK